VHMYGIRCLTQSKYLHMQEIEILWWRLATYFWNASEIKEAMCMHMHSVEIFISVRHICIMACKVD
jgi:hypothetical protein